MITRRSAIFFAILSSMLSSLGWIFQGTAVLALGGMVVAAVQGLLAGVIYLLHLRWTGRKIPFALIAENKRDLIQFTFLRSILASVLFCYALETSPTIKVMFFTKLEPYFIIFWSWLLMGQVVSRYHGVLLAVHIGGAILLSTGGQMSVQEGQIGDLMVFVAMCVLSYSYLNAARLSKSLGAVHTNGVSALVSGLFLMPFAVAIAPASAWNVFTYAWLNLVIVVLLFNVFALTLWYAALRHVEPWLVSALRAVGPVLAAPLAWIVLGERLDQIQIGGAAIVLLTSALLAASKSDVEKSTVIPKAVQGA